MTAGYLDLWQAADELGRAVYGEAWTGSEHFARSEDSRCASFERAEREIKHMQQAHGYTREYILGMSLGEWQKSATTSAAADLPALTESEKEAARAAAADDHHAYEAGCYARLTGVVSLLRRWLQEARVSASAIRPDGISVALSSETWTPVLTPPSVFQAGTLVLPLFGERPVFVDRTQFDAALRAHTERLP